METYKITLSNLIIQGFEQQEDVEASVQFIVTPEQKGCLSGRWEDAEEWIPKSLEICSVKPLQSLIMEDCLGGQHYIPRKNNLLYLLTDEQIEDIIDAVYKLKGN